MCLKEILDYAQNMLTILGSIVNITGGDMYDHFKNFKIVTLIMNKIFICAQKIMRKIATATVWISKSSFTSCMFHILPQVGAEKSAQ